MASDEIVLTDENIPPMQDELFRLYSQGFLTDITLSCEDGKNFEAHRVLLAARSQYFYGIVPKLKLEPVIFLKGVKGSHLEKILKYIYSGSAIVSRTQLKSVLEVARSLQVKGLQELAPTELNKGLNSSFSGSPPAASSAPLRSKENVFNKHNTLQYHQKQYDKLSSKKSSLGKLNQYSPSLSKKQKSSVKESATKSFREDENGEEIFNFQYQYISDDSEDLDKDDSNDSDFEVAKKKLNKEKELSEAELKKKRGRPPKETNTKARKSFGKDESDAEYRKHSRSSSDDDSDNSSDLDQDDDSDSDSDGDSDNGEASASDEEEDLVKRSSKTSPRGTDKSAKTPALPLTPSKRSGRGPHINGQDILPIQCKVLSATLLIFISILTWCDGIMV